MKILIVGPLSRIHVCVSISKRVPREARYKRGQASPPQGSRPVNKAYGIALSSLLPGKNTKGLSTSQLN